MKSDDLNRKLIEQLPRLRQKYNDEVSWQEGDSTGSHTVFGDVLTPYLEYSKVQLIYLKRELI